MHVLRDVILAHEAKPVKPLELLRESSQQDATWDDHRAFADKMMQALHTADLGKYSGRVRDCATALFFSIKPDAATGEEHFKLKSASFCHFRHCPVCQWRRSMRNKGIFLTQVPLIEEQYPTARWLMLTLTVRNCHVDELRETISAMNKGWKALIQRAEFKAVDGWIRSVEVTRGKDGSAHPHYHVLAMVPASYFGKGYVSTATWAKIWKECLKVDYVPVCDARAAKPRTYTDKSGQSVEKSALRAGAAEVLKYATKGQDLLDGGPEWLATYIAQVHGLKFLTSGGALKNLFKKVKQENESDNDLIHVDVDEEEGGDNNSVLRFDWYRKQKRYGRKRD